MYSFFLFLFLLAPSFVFAEVVQPAPTSTGITITNPIGSDSFIDLLKKIINWLIEIGGVIAVGMVIYGALQMIFAAGNPEKFKKGRQTIMYTVIGYAIILIGWGITEIIRSALSAR